ncbi:MAG: hypothetical protein WDW38_002664 [Sanguina aurantia]
MQLSRTCNPAFSCKAQRRSFRVVRVLPVRASLAAPSTSESTSSPVIKQLKAVPLTADAFRPFGQVVGFSDDGKVYDKNDAQLVLDKGTPRFYIMRLPRRGYTFHRITYHKQVTQCLGALSPVTHWYMAVAQATANVQDYPTEQDLTVFRIPHGVFVKMNPGTWHAGPLFDEAPHMDFYNLELKDTNVVDHNTHDYLAANGCRMEIVDTLDASGVVPGRSG